MELVKNTESKAFVWNILALGIVSLPLSENDDDDLKFISNYHSVKFLITTRQELVQLHNTNIVLGTVLECVTQI